MLQDAPPPDDDDRDDANPRLPGVIVIIAVLGAVVWAVIFVLILT